MNITYECFEVIMIQKSIENLTQIDQGSNKEKKELDFIDLTLL